MAIGFHQPVDMVEMNQTSTGATTDSQIKSEAMNKSVTPTKAGVRPIENTGFRLPPE